MTENRSHIYLCNAIDEKTKNQRKVLTDSPAATNKVMSLARALRAQGERPWVLSLGRGKQDGSLARHRSSIRRIGGIPVVYCAFWNVPVLTHFVTMVSAAWLTLQLRYRFSKPPNLLVYNRSFHYLLALVCARFTSVACFLDLEDGYIVEGRGKLRQIKNNFTRKLFHHLCSSGAMVATSALGGQLDRANPTVCYGVADTEHPIFSKNWEATKLNVLFSGTLLDEAGAALLLAALKIVKQKFPEEAGCLRFFVSGKGPYSQAFSEYALASDGLMEFCGQLKRDDYLRLLEMCHVGLSLRLQAFEMGGTTFPSKVIEYASHGLTVLTTYSSDVPLLFGDAALYLDTETPDALAELLSSLPHSRNELQAISIAGTEQVRQKCSQSAVGKALQSMFHGAVPK